MRKQHVVVLSEFELRVRARPAPQPDRPGERPARALTHARILLKANQGQPGPGWTDRAIAAALDPSHHRGSGAPAVRRGGLEAAVDRKAPEREYRRKLDGEQEAHLAALACSAPPEGRKRWTLRLLAERLVQLEVVDAVSNETVRQAFSKPAQAVVEGMLVHPAGGRRRVLLADGGCAGCLHPAV
jgi:Homeodomain-like domain